ncbi:unnamed protein product [Parnassius mnemosyne]|uniref:Uncharacterized protein n=1 Tax=Parnassius mnemosyne TaxID=213953 RepID=A0AAV1KL35_9NEOP
MVIPVLQSFFHSTTRRISTSTVNMSQSLVKLKRLQSNFQREDGKPVWLKRGLSDRVLYSTTIVLCFVGVGMTLAFIYDQAKPPSWKNSIC